MNRRTDGSFDLNAELAFVGRRRELLSDERQQHHAADENSDRRDDHDEPPPQREFQNAAVNAFDHREDRFKRGVETGEQSFARRFVPFIGHLQHAAHSIGDSVNAINVDTTTANVTVMPNS